MTKQELGAIRKNTIYEKKQRSEIFAIMIVSSDGSRHKEVGEIENGILMTK